MRGELETRTRRRSQGDGGQDMLTGKQRAFLDEAIEIFGNKKEFPLLMVCSRGIDSSLSTF